MKNWLSRVAVGLAAALACASLPAAAQEQAVPKQAIENGQAGARPVAVVSIASIDEVLGDVGYLTETAGQGDFGKMLALLSGGYTVGMDKQRPLGMVVTIENDEPKALAFLPIRNLNAVLAGLEEQVGKPQDAGNGVLELGGAAGNPFYVKEVNGWAFVSQRANDLADLPPLDPAAALGDLTKTYTLAVRINVENIPAEAKKVAIAQIRAQFERQLQEQLDQQPEDQREITERYMRTMAQRFTSFIEETEQLTVGLQVDAQAGTTHLDFSLVARPDTNLAQQMALVSDTASSHAGFLAAEAAVNAHGVSRIAEDDKALYQDMLKTARENALKEIENDEDLETEAEQQIARDVINALFDVAEKTVAAGKFDGGAALFLSPQGKLNFVVGGTVQDAARLEETFKKVVEAAQNEPKAPQVAYDADQHAGVRFHTLKLPIQGEEQDARKLFGDHLDVAVGFGEEKVYLALGAEGIAKTKSILDASQARADQPTPPGQFIVSLGPILQFAAAVKDDPTVAALAEILQQAQGQDHISLKAQSIERGLRYRLEVEQGVLQLIGAAARTLNQQRQQAPNAF